MKYVVLYLDYNGTVSDYEIVNGQLEAAIGHAKQNYRNYGHYTATVVPYNPIYRVSRQEVETTDPKEMGA